MFDVIFVPAYLVPGAPSGYRVVDTMPFGMDCMPVPASAVNLFCVFTLVFLLAVADNVAAITQ